jgi:large subunit ribosomal protein L31
VKKDLHPKDYRFVVFVDEAANFSFLTRSTAKSEETIKWTDGKEYPLIKIQISSKSHPFFTGEEKIIDTEGRVDRFKARAKKAEELKKNIGSKTKKAEKEAKKKEDKSKEKTAA